MDGKEMSPYLQWWSVLLVGLLIIVIFNYSTKGKEGFTIPKTYNAPSSYTQTVVSPMFSEEFHEPSPAYDIYINSSSPPEPEVKMSSASYPYGNYMTNLNVLPHDEETIRKGACGSTKARGFGNNFKLYADLGYREEMSRIFKKKLERRFRSSCQDTVSPYFSY